MNFYAFQIKGELSPRVIQASSYEDAREKAVAISHSVQETETIFWNFHSLREINQQDADYYLEN